jgi:hypothetical protein
VADENKRGGGGDRGGDRNRQPQHEEKGNTKRSDNNVSFDRPVPPEKPRKG